MYINILNHHPVIEFGHNKIESVVFELTSTIHQPNTTKFRESSVPAEEASNSSPPPDAREVHSIERCSNNNDNDDIDNDNEDVTINMATITKYITDEYNYG